VLPPGELTVNIAVLPSGQLTVNIAVLPPGELTVNIAVLPPGQLTRMIPKTSAKKLQTSLHCVSENKRDHYD